MVDRTHEFHYHYGTRPSSVSDEPKNPFFHSASILWGEIECCRNDNELKQCSEQLSEVRDLAMAETKIPAVVRQQILDWLTEILKEEIGNVMYHVSIISMCCTVRI